VKNKSVRSEVRTSIKKFHQSVETNNKAETEKIFRETQQLLDSAAGKGVFHANTVARTKSRLVHRMNKLAAS
jgi:small subunit ribosomal protein S20